MKIRWFLITSEEVDKIRIQLEYILSGGDTGKFQ